MQHTYIHACADVCMYMHLQAEIHVTLMWMHNRGTSVVFVPGPS